jgi:MGT family glycosyltransferase
MPFSLQPGASVPVGDLQPMRLEPPPQVGDSLPSWAKKLDPARRPVVYISLGTTIVFSQPELLRIILDGVARLAVDVVVTVGAHNDPSTFGPQPDTVHLEHWLPLPALLSRCSLVVCHGGSGTLLASLAAGLPLVLLPRGSDQFDNAAACARAGVARVVPPEALDSGAVATEVQCLLDDRSYSEAAARLRAEIETMPAPTAVVPRLERLVTTDGIFCGGPQVDRERTYKMNHAPG